MQISIDHPLLHRITGPLKETPLDELDKAVNSLLIKVKVLLGLVSPYRILSSTLKLMFFSTESK
jgi:hypothetical protein